MGPLNEEPVSIRPPFDQRPPALPFDPDTERWRASIRADRIAAISEALAGVELGEYDRKMIEWMAGWDEPTIGTWVSLLYRTRRAGGTFRAGGTS
jgi:hypothetical protein